MDASVLSQLMIYLSHIFYKNNGNNQNVSLQQQQTPKMKICCQDTVVKKQDIYIYKGSNKQHRKKILTPQNQLNPIISHTDEPIMMLAISKEETTLVKCEELKQQYTDLQFMPGSSSIGEYSGRKIQWVRLSRIVSSFILDQYNPATILTLKEGDTYFLASLAALAQTPAIIDEAFDQQLKLSSMGAYKLNVSLNGKPQQIIIDDYLPVFAQNHERSAFAHIDPSHIWVVLFEKVYAKIQGNYRKISFGYAHEVLETFSMSPCLYHLINTDFSHEEQQKVWNILKQSLQMQFPTVIGSRKKFTCNAIVPHQSYCLKTCKIIKNRKDEEKRVYLWNAPGMQQIEQKGISYEKNGDVISLNLVEFMRNFEIIDVAHVRHNYSSLFYQFNCGPTKPIQYAFSTIQKTSFYLTFHRQQGDKGRLRIILINCTNEATYEYVAGKKEEIYDDVTLHIQKLPIGSYVVICQSETDISTLLRVYSQKTVPLLKFTGKKDTLLQRMFMQMAYALPSQQFALSKQHQDWYISKILFEQLGLAFFAVYLDYKSLLKCEISLNNKQLNLQGLRLLNKNIKEGYAMVIQKGQSDIFIFEFIGKDNSSFSFPPSSMKIKVLI